MELLTFAHRGEAKAFLKKDNFTAVPFIFDGLYKNNNRYLLIHGEGSQITSEKLSAVCGAFKISVVINLGVCGSLNENTFPIGTVYPIRTCYREDEFKSYSTANTFGVDIITSKERVTDPEKAKNLSFFAQLVDREAWAVGSVCHTLNIPFYSYKLVSDYSNNQDICQLVASKSEEISEALYNYLVEIKIEKNEEECHPEISGSVSQKRLFKSLSKKIELKGINVDIKEIESLNLSPKKKMSKILEKMEKDLFPFETKLRADLANLTQEVKNSKIDVKFAKDFEEPSISFSFSIKNQRELDTILSSLNNFPTQKISNLLNGRPDV